VELSSASIQAIESMPSGTDIKSVEDVWQSLTLTVALTSEPPTHWLKTKEVHPSTVTLARAKVQSSQQDGEVTPGLIRRAASITSHLAASAVFSKSYQHTGQYSALMPKVWKTKHASSRTEVGVTPPALHAACEDLKFTASIWVQSDAQFLLDLPQLSGMPSSHIPIRQVQGLIASRTHLV
jgi:hypothetical protein